MIPKVPHLADYGLSPLRGFLPDVLPLSRLPDPFYNKWEAVVANLPALILSRRLRGVVDRLPVLSTIGLEHEAEWRRAYMLLCYMAHGYIWGDDVPSERLPEAISVPLLHISEHLELPPVATYAAVCLWNFKPLFVDEEIDNMENLATLATFTGSTDESWFYLISVAIEARGAVSIPLMLEAITAARENDPITVSACLQTLAERLTDLTTLLDRMHERCDPHIFYHRIRPFLAGSRNMADAGLPNGVLYTDEYGKSEWKHLSGGSNAQSSLIQFFDIVLGVEHRPTNKYSGPPAGHSFMDEMRKYMPGPHARFLADVAEVANIKAYVHENSHIPSLVLAYDACIAMLTAFRSRHLVIISRYIIIPSRAANQNKPPVEKEATNIANSGKLTGTGGTALMPFLKQARDETAEPAVEEWARQFMLRQKKTEGQGDFFLGKDEGTMEVNSWGVGGLAGSWSLGDGGFCNY